MYAVKMYDSPIGILTITASEKGITRIDFDTKEAVSEEVPGPEAAEAIITKTKSEFDEYFAGTRTKFDVPLDFEAGTEFQLDVWNELITIPFGKTATYSQVAKAVGRPKACRAVGGANNKNPIPILVPCHRVIGASGKPVGFAGGIDKKMVLLELEKDHSDS